MSTQNTPAGAAGATNDNAAAAAAAGTPTPQGDAAAAAAAQGENAAAAAAAAAAATPTPDGQAGAGAGTTTGTEGKTPEQIAAEAAAAAGGTPQGAPDKYALTVPEGGHLDEADVAAFESIARAKGLSNEAAQAVLTEQAAHLKAQSAAFLTKLHAHPEIGGSNLEAAQLHANTFLDRVLPSATPEGAELRSLFAKTGYGNHPAVVLLLARAGKAMAEDTPITDRAGARGAARKSTADVLFGGQ